MQVRHVPTDADDGDDETGERTLATDVEFAETFAEQAKGLMGRDSVPEDYALVFEFDEPPRWVPGPMANWRSIHMLFVKVPLDVVWVLDGSVTKVKTVSPWTGLGLGKADTVIELPAGAAEKVAAGDDIEIAGGE